MTPLERLEAERWMPPDWAVSMRAEDAIRALEAERPPRRRKRSSKELRQIAAEADIQETLKRARQRMAGLSRERKK